MVLVRYLELAGITPTEFARRLGVRHSTVLRWLRGRRSIPDRETMSRIYKLTDGSVTADDFYGLRDTSLPTAKTGRDIAPSLCGTVGTGTKSTKVSR